MTGQGAAALGSGLGAVWPSPQPPLGRAPGRRPHVHSWRPRGTSRGPRLRSDLAEVDEPFAFPGLTTTSDTSGTMLHCILQPLANRRQCAPSKQHRLQAAGSQDASHSGQAPNRWSVERPAAWADRGRLRDCQGHSPGWTVQVASPALGASGVGGAGAAAILWLTARRPPHQYLNALFFIKNIFRSTSLSRQKEALGKRVCKSAPCDHVDGPEGVVYVK